ncbi:MAG: hypothetical protein ACYTG2_14920 [Planctomycetota bacterium]|jgi:hypothetical protein
MPLDPTAARDLSSRTAIAVLVAVVLVSLVLRMWNGSHGLPAVLHSDYRQVEQAAWLLEEGSVTHRVPYLPGNTFAYAAADALVWATTRVLGSGESWDEFVTRLQSASVHHTIGRGYVSCLGSLLAVAVYLLARQRFPRRVALLAAAIAAFAPMQIIFSHQARIHVPAIVVLSFAAIAVMKLGAGQATKRTAAAAGIGAAASVAMVQYGWLLLGTAGLLTLLVVRPWRSALRLGLVMSLSFLIVHAVTLLLMYRTGFIEVPEGQRVFGDFWTLGMSRSSVSLQPAMFVQLVLSWILSEPVRAFCLVLFGVACLRGRLRPRDGLVYGLYPAIALCVIGAGIGAQPRYAMSATPFLAVLAAAGVLSVRAAWPRRVLVALLLVVPLSTAIRYDLLIDRPDTRVTMASVLGSIASPETRVTINHELVLNPNRIPAHVVTLPPGGDYRVMQTGSDWAIRLLAESSTLIFVRPSGAWAADSADDEQLLALGFQFYGSLAGGADGTDFLPDAPQHPTLDIWTVQRPGPTIEVWVRSERALARLQRLLPVSELASLGLRPVSGELPSPTDS